MRGQRIQHVKELERWAWLSLKDITDPQEYRLQVQQRARMSLGVSNPTAKDYAEVITLRRFNIIPDQNKTDYMLSKGYEQYEGLSLSQALNLERDEAQSVESRLIERRKDDQRDVMPEKEIVEEDDG